MDRFHDVCGFVMLDLNQNNGSSPSFIDVATTAFANDRFNILFAFAGKFLNAPDQFRFLPLDVLQVIVRELGELLFQPALGDVPVSFELKFVHKISFCLPY